jgi:hypothetical protein
MTDRVQRKTIGFFPGSAPRVRISTNVVMFSEDFAEHVLPYASHTRKEKKYKLSIAGEAAEITKAHQILETVVGERHHDDEELIEEVIRHLAKRLAWFGEVYFEIASSRRDGSKVLAEVPGDTFARVFFWYVQYVPFSSWRATRAILKWVDGKSVWHLAVPNELGGTYGYRRLLRRLRAADPITPNHWDPSKPRLGNLMTFARLRDRYIARCTRSLGWNWRNMSQSGITEFYYFYRTIRLCESQVTLRDHIAAELNRLFRKLRIDARIRIEGLPSAHDVQVTLRKMEAGEMSFAAAFDAASPY